MAFFEMAVAFGCIVASMMGYASASFVVFVGAMIAFHHYRIAELNDRIASLRLCRPVSLRRVDYGIDLENLAQEKLKK